MKVSESGLPGVLVIEPKIHSDNRGYFLETFNAERYLSAGVPDYFVQDNLSFSKANVLRGLHLQHPNGQGKLVYVVEGEIFDVAVDLRDGSPGFARWAGEILSAANGLQLYIPEGFAHGFYVLSETARVAYKCTAVFDAAAELTVRWDDPDIGIVWPVRDPLLSKKDAAAPLLRDIEPGRLPKFRAGP